MDVGAGSGILSLFAAKAGAKRVIAVEASTAASAAKVLVESNNLGHIVRLMIRVDTSSGVMCRRP